MITGFKVGSFQFSRCNRDHCEGDQVMHVNENIS